MKTKPILGGGFIAAIVFGLMLTSGGVSVAPSGDHDGDLLGRAKTKTKYEGDRSIEMTVTWSADRIPDKEIDDLIWIDWRIGNESAGIPNHGRNPIKPEAIKQNGNQRTWSLAAQLLGPGQHEIPYDGKSYSYVVVNAHGDTECRLYVDRVKRRQDLTAEPRNDGRSRVSCEYEGVG